jgi:transposase-like protein
MMHTIPNRRYTLEFQEAAVQQVLDSGKSINEVAGRLEMPARTLGNWARQNQTTDASKGSRARCWASKTFTRPNGR